MTQELRCAESGQIPARDARGWKAELARDPRVDPGPDVVLFCPDCWSRESNTPGHLNHWSLRQFRALLASYSEVVEVRRPFPWTMLLVDVTCGPPVAASAGE
jgi:hypothetical protein